MVDEGCRGEKAYGDILVVHNHKDHNGIDSGDLIVHGEEAVLKTGLWIGIKKENTLIPTFIRISLDDAVEVAATLMWAAQFKE